MFIAKFRSIEYPWSPIASPTACTIVILVPLSCCNQKLKIKIEEITSSRIVSCDSGDWETQTKRPLKPDVAASGCHLSTGRLRQNCQELEASLGYIVISRSIRAT